MDLEVEAEEIKLGNKKSMFCSKCHCAFKTTNKNEIENWIKHKKNAKVLLIKLIIIILIQNHLI